MSEYDLPRITEKRYLAIPPRAFTANGTTEGLVTIETTFSFKVGQLVILKSNTQASFKVKVQKVLSETQLVVININESVTTKNKLDISLFLLADTATIELLEDKRPVIDLHEIQRQVYEEEPTVALRNHLVDFLGRSYNADNPLPVQISDEINIGTVNAEMEVALQHRDNYPDEGDVADSVRIGDGTTELAIDPLNRSISVNRYEKLLGLLANANWMKLGDFDAVEPTFVGNVATLNYVQNSAIIGRAVFTFNTDSDWNIVLERFINDTDGTQLLDDDGSFLNLD